VQTTTTGSCQIELFAGLSAHRRKGSRILPTPCPVCGVEFKPRSGAKYCSHKCAVIQIGRQKKGKTIDPDLIAWHKCATCHAIMGMPGKMSGDLLRKDRSTICTFRKENALPTLSKSQATKSASIKKGKSQAILGEQWWKENWGCVVDTYWSLCSQRVISQICKKQKKKVILSKKEWRKIWYEKNKSKLKAQRLKWVKENSDRIKISRLKQRARPEVRLRENIRKRLKKILVSFSDTFAQSVGCTPRQLRLYIEAQFTKRMNWDNYGIYWHVDHIQPLASFDLLDPIQRNIACNYANLRPLEAKKNLQKSDTIEFPQLHLCMAM